MEVSRLLSPAAGPVAVTGEPALVVVIVAFVPGAAAEPELALPRRVADTRVPAFSLLLIELSLLTMAALADAEVDRLGRPKCVDVRGSLLLEPEPLDDPMDDSPLTRRGMMLPPPLAAPIPSLLRGRYRAASRSCVNPIVPRLGVAATSIKADD